MKKRRPNGLGRACRREEDRRFFKHIKRRFQSPKWCNQHLSKASLKSARTVLLIMEDDDYVSRVRGWGSRGIERKEMCDDGMNVSPAQYSIGSEKKTHKSFVSALQGEIISLSYHSIEIMSDIENLWKPPAKISYTSAEFLIHFKKEICEICVCFSHSHSYSNYFPLSSLSS